MRNGVVLQDDLYIKENFYPEFENIFSFSCFEENISQYLYALASTKNSGLLTLINNLLNEEQVGTKLQKIRNYASANRLIRNFRSITIKIAPSEQKDTISFIKKTIEEAEYMILDTSRKDAIVYLYAKRLVSTINFCQTDQQGPLFQVLEKHWEEFVIHFLKEKLQQILKNI